MTKESEVSEDMRQAFEATMRMTFLPDYYKELDAHGNYLHEGIKHEWQMWQAAWHVRDAEIAALTDDAIAMANEILRLNAEIAQLKLSREETEMLRQGEELRKEVCGDEGDEFTCGNGQQHRVKHNRCFYCEIAHLNEALESSQSAVHSVNERYLNLQLAGDAEIADELDILKGAIWTILDSHKGSVDVIVANTGVSGLANSVKLVVEALDIDLAERDSEIRQLVDAYDILCDSFNAAAKHCIREKGHQGPCRGYEPKVLGHCDTEHNNIPHVKSPECENWMPMTAETTETATPTDREKALAAAEEIKSWGGFTEERVADIILKHMQPDRELVEALRIALPMLQHSFTPKARCGQANTKCNACKLRNRAESVLSKREREK